MYANIMIKSRKHNAIKIVTNTFSLILLFRILINGSMTRNTEGQLRVIFNILTKITECQKM